MTKTVCFSKDFNHFLLVENFIVKPLALLNALKFTYYIYKR